MDLTDEERARVGLLNDIEDIDSKTVEHAKFSDDDDYLIITFTDKTVLLVCSESMDGLFVESYPYGEFLKQENIISDDMWSDILRRQRYRSLNDQIQQKEEELEKLRTQLREFINE